MTQRDNTGIETKTSVELVNDLRAADLSDLCDAAELAITDGGGFGWLAPPPRDVLELSLIHISEPTDTMSSRMPSSA